MRASAGLIVCVVITMAVAPNAAAQQRQGLDLTAGIEALKPLLAPIPIDSESDVIAVRLSVAHGAGGSLVRVDREGHPPATPGTSTYRSDFFYWVIDKRLNTYAVFLLTGAASDAIRIRGYLRRHGDTQSLDAVQRQIADFRRDRVRSAELWSRQSRSQDAVAVEAESNTHGPAAMTGFCEGHGSVVAWTRDPIFITTTSTTLNVDWGRAAPMDGGTIAYMSPNRSCYAKDRGNWPPPANTQWYTDSCTLSSSGSFNSFDAEADGTYHNDDFAGGIFGTTHVFEAAAANVTQYAGFTWSEFHYIADGASGLLTGAGSGTANETCYFGGGGSCEMDQQTINSCEAQSTAEGIWSWDPETCNCIYGASPIIVDLDGNPNGLRLTSPENGVHFDLLTSGAPQQVAWTRAGSRDAFLVLDRNGDGKISDGSELFGNFTPQPEPEGRKQRNGFLALAVYDEPENGGNSDGRITAQDTIFGFLRLWIDKNHDGVSQPGELFTLRQMRVTEISLKYTLSKKRDEFGNQFRYRSHVEVDRNPDDLRPPTPRVAIDVLLAYIR